jgi:hypothetical protein
MPALSLATFSEHTIAPIADVEEITRLRATTSGDTGGADAAANKLLVTSETPMGSPLTACAISLLTVTPSELVVGNATDYATIIIRKHAADGTVTTLGSVSSSSSDWLAQIPINVVPSTGLAVGDLVTVAITKSGAGVALPSLRVDCLPAENFITRRIADHESWMGSRLTKRYATPFADPVPSIVISWLVGLVTADLFAKRGFNPGSAQDEEAILGRAQRARDEIKEAADSKDGLFDLPIREDLPGTSAITRGGPLAYSEASAYTWIDVQAEAVRNG